MDFARRQLEKYGWTDGKGLGKHENGMSEALKPKLKRSVTGIGHDPASQFNEHWWSALYDKAAKNVEVKEKNGITKKIKTVDTTEFKITNSTWRINKKQKDVSDNEYSEYFIRKAVLTNDGSQVENVAGSESEDEVKDTKDMFKLTDEELFAACEGRTAHKGARHGLKATGKLARIAQQEQLLLTQAKYEGYSHTKKIKQKPEKVVENLTIECTEDVPKKKKKKRKCFSNENGMANMVDPGQHLPEGFENSIVAIHINDIENGRTIKINEEVDSQTITLKKSRKKRHLESKNDIMEMSEAQEVDGATESINETGILKKKKKKKHKYD